MKAPPFLLMAGLLFWGWQSDLLLVGAILGIALEAARFTNARWELDGPDFSRIWSFCVLLNVILIGYIFTTNDEGGLKGLLHGSPAQNAAHASALTATRFLRWLPITTFALMLAQAYNSRPSVPLTGISLVLRWRQRKGDHAFAGDFLNISFPYFILCLFSAGIHPNNSSPTYFLGQCVLVAWALWTMRSRRFGRLAWLGALTVVIGLGALGNYGISRAEQAIQNFDAQWLSKFFSQRPDPLQSLTSMGRIGQLKLSARIVIWLEPRKLGQVPEYLREASYRNYHAQKMTWYTGGGLNDFEMRFADPDNPSNWTFLPSRTNSTFAVNIACYLNGWSRESEAPEGLLPLPSGCGRLQNVPANMVLRLNKNGAVLAAGRGLLMFDALYGRGATMDSLPDTASTNHFDTIVPTNEIPALQQVIAELNLAPDATYLQKLQAIQKFFSDKFTYSTWQGMDKLATSNASPLTRFLLTSRSGHCEYFATATALLLRQMGVPARYAIGYSVHEPRGSGYIVRERDAHAWCLVWNPVTTSWEDFDTTPPSWVAIESQRTSFGEWFADLRSWLGFQIAKFRWQQAHLRQYLLWSLIPMMIVLIYHIIFRRSGRRKKTDKKSKIAAPIHWPGRDSEFYQLERQLVSRGLPRQTSEPLADWLERALAEPTLADLRAPLQELLRLHYRYRFDPEGLRPEERTLFARKATLALAELARK